MKQAAAEYQYSILNQATGACFRAASDESVLEAGLRQGFTFPHHCRNGHCGSCKAKLLQGEVEHRYFEADALTEKERASGKVLLCQAVAQTDIVIDVSELALPGSAQVRTLPCRVEEINRLAEDVIQLKLATPKGKGLQYHAGQYVDILLADGRRRSFSIANRPDDRHRVELHIRHVPGGRFTDQLFQDLKIKSLLRIQGPFGTFMLRESSYHPMVFVAGGTGFGPIKGIIEYALAIGVTRPMHFFWGVRALKDLYCSSLPESWQENHEFFRFTPVLSEPDTDDAWQGEIGWVHEAVLRFYPDLAGHEVYMAGPPVMIEAGFKDFTSADLPESRFYTDIFEYAKN